MQQQQTILAKAQQLYYTDARVETYLTTNSFTDETYVDGEIATATTNLQTYADPSRN